MQLLYEGKDITKDVEIKKADIIDNAGGAADSIELWLDDPRGFWSKWKPEKDHKVQLKESGYSSGLMYVDELEQNRGIFIIRALSIPQEAKTANTKAWEEVRFLELATEIANKYGFSLETYGIQNYLYDRVDQYEQADFAFLAWRCALEGYVLKVCDRKVIIYSEKYMESQAPAKTIHASEFDGEYLFRVVSTDIYGSCKMVHGNMSYTFNSPGVHGPVLKPTDIYFSNMVEAERFSKGLLRQKNKFEKTGWGTVKFDASITAGNTLNIKGVGLADGIYFCDQAVHKLVDQKTLLKLHRPLEGY